MIKIRKYKKQDVKEIKKLVKTVLFEIFKTKAKNLDDLDNIEKEYIEKNGNFFVLDFDGKIIGSIAVRKEYNKVARLKRMFIYKKYRGKGYGKKLLYRVILFCKERGYKKIILSTHPKFKSAMELYRNSDFKRYKKIKDRIFFQKKI